LIAKLLRRSDKPNFPTGAVKVALATSAVL